MSIKLFIPTDGKSSNGALRQDRGVNLFDSPLSKHIGEMYSSFNIEDEDNKYRLHATKQSPQPSFAGFNYLKMGLDNRRNFVAVDRDYDSRAGKHCARDALAGNGFGGWMQTTDAGCIAPNVMLFNAKVPKYKPAGEPFTDYQQSFIMFREKD